MNQQELKDFLDAKSEEFNTPHFIYNDPICVPHQFQKLQDIEIAGFFAATFAWGQRKTIINKSNQLMALMDHQPYEFVCNASDVELEQLNQFKHRTFNSEDLQYFVRFLRHHYQNNDSLEQAFNLDKSSIENRLTAFNQYFFSLPNHPIRTYKHVASPAKKSTCKRLNMYLRWMVRKDDNGVDFGLWNTIQPSDLMIPFDVHVERIARKLGMLNRKQNDWQTVVELSNYLRKLDPKDPIKYDFALFGLGVIEKFA